MTSFSRRMKRNKRKDFIKSFKKTMKSFEKIVRCVVCDRVPNALADEKIDDWTIKKAGDSVRLICPSCEEVENVE